MTGDHCVNIASAVLQLLLLQSQAAALWLAITTLYALHEHTCYVQVQGCLKA